MLPPYLNSTVFGARGKQTARVGEAEVQNLVIVLLQSLHFNARDGVVEPLELIIPGDTPRRTWVPGHLAGHAVVAVEELLPQELVAGHGAPLLAHEPHRQHVGVVQVQEDLEQDAVGEQGAAARVHRVILPPPRPGRGEAHLCVSEQLVSPCHIQPCPHTVLSPGDKDARTGL
uniref:Uncharacterized protein n=1 Tax=Anas platyrhynchos platyrhynchos TaxID=8840 RepID=A0A493TPK4_ANAPP